MSVRTSQFLSAASTNPLQQFAYSASDKNQQFQYDPVTRQIYSPSTGLCLDDMGAGYSSQSSSDDHLAFQTCGTSSHQQFVYQPQSQYLLNPTNAFNKCLDGGGTTIYLWYCPDGGTNHQWVITLICSPGKS